MKQILVIDNYDSFTYNLVHILQDLDCEVIVRRNDRISLEEVDQFQKILLSPGPGIPDEAGLLKPIIARYAANKSILGVCLGQQAIGEVFGGSLENLSKVYHGVSTKINLTNSDDVLYRNIPKQFEVGRYHSWVVSRNLPEVLIPTAIDENGEIMSLKHRDYDLRAVQYHPESILTEHGREILKNWIES
ncbi:MAG: aminodeoxychorismate/anthranilate synthase component II [Flavobacteriaceae bacterium]|nr:aminodeoxychorismate/anthranilate synthase component II [Flavobacteriaceae bacterium]